MPASNAEHGNFRHSDYLSIYIAVLLAVQVFDCDVKPWEGVVYGRDHYLNYLNSGTSINKWNTGVYIHETGNNALGLNFTIPFAKSFWLSFSWTRKFSPAYCQNLSHSLLIGHIKIGYAWPCPHGLLSFLNMYSLQKHRNVAGYIWKMYKLLQGL